MDKTTNAFAKLNSFNTERLALKLMTENEWQIFVDHVIEADEFYEMFACEMTEELLASVRGLFETRKTISYSIYLPNTNDMIGYVEFCVDEGNRDYNHIAYCIFKDYRGHGFATEAAASLVDKLLSGEVLGRPANEIRAWTVWGNSASSRVLEKIGFHSTGYRIYDSGLIDQNFIYGPEGMEETA
jgi:RimJ/RimL family protein N-acetyltransferase